MRMDVFVYFPSRPPSYEQSIKNDYISDDPPSYSIFSDDDDDDNNSTKTQTLTSILQIFMEYLSFILAILFLFLVPFTSFVIGTLYWNDCPVEPLLPAYLILVGVIGVVRNCVALSEPIIHNNYLAFSSEFFEERSNILLFFDCIILSWFSLGNIWLLQAAFNKNDENENSYCHPVIFWYTFSNIMLFYLTIIITLILYVILNREFLFNIKQIEPPPYNSE